MSVDSVVAVPRPPTPRGGWGWLLLTAGSRSYLSFLATLAACAVFPLLFGLSGAIVQSGSMEPLINAGDVVLTQALPARAAAPMGHVVIFPAPSGSARPGTELHRVVAVNTDGTLMTAGDNNEDPDSSPLNRGDILGQGRLLVPWVGLPSFWSGHGQFLPLTIWALLTLAAIAIGALDASTTRPPGPMTRPGGTASTTGPGRGSSGGSLGAGTPPAQTPVRAGRANSALHRLVRGALRVRPSLAAAVVLIVALALAPLGMAGAAFSATTGSAGAWSTSGAADHLVVTTSPTSSPAGVAFATQPVVEVQDASGQVVAVSSAQVTLSLVTAAGASLTCAANPVNATAGVATFTGCAIDTMGSYTLRATSGTLVSAVSTVFTITVGPATKLSFTTNPSGATGGAALATQPVVTVQDVQGNTATASSAAVTLALTTPAGATLTCATNPKPTVAGVATFTGCAVDKVGTYTLTATAAGLTSVVSTSLTITVGPAKKLSFTTSPAASTAGTNFPTQPRVTVQDAGGNTVTSPSASITLTITPPTGGATLSCTQNPRTTSSGVATFSGCRINTAGTYTLTATSGTLTATTSASFTIAGPATKLAFTTNPSSSTSNTAFTTQPVVTVLDANGAKVTTSTASVTLSLTTPAGATLTCTANPKAAVAGVDAFAGCRVNLVGTYTLTASSSGLTSATSTTFTITAGAANRLAFTTSPSGSTSSAAFATQPAVTVRDAAGNTVTTSTAAVTLSLTTPAGATLTCTANPKAAVAGAATFAGCKVDKAGTYTLTATSSGLTSAASTSFTITAGAASKLAFTTNASSATAGTSFTTQPVVTVQDAAGNPVTTSTASVTLAITTPAGAVLTCTTNPKAAASGLATFAGCSINKVGTYTLTATATGLTSAVSTSLTISVGSAAKLAFTTSPSAAVRNTAFGTQPVVTIQDTSGNTVTTSTASVTLSITSGGSPTLTCTANPTSAVAGITTFAGCRINTAGTYTLTATASGLTATLSSSFTIS